MRRALRTARAARRSARAPARPQSPAQGFPERAARTRELAGRRRLLYCALALIVALALALESMTLPALLALLAGARFGYDARELFSRARVARIGARSESIVRSQLALLEQRGWTVGHNIACPRIGDIDHIAFAPAPSPTFVISTKTKSYAPRDLDQIAAVARDFDRRAGVEHTTAILVTLARTPTHIERGVIRCDVYDLVRVMRSVHAEFRRRGARELSAA